MPLKPGSSRKTISSNISELAGSQTKAGKRRSLKQNIAIALQKAGKSNPKASQGRKPANKKVIKPKSKRGRK